MSPSMFDHGIHLGYFDPAKGHVPNPGMGLQAYAFSDHMHWGWNREEWQRTEVTAPNRELPRAVFDRMIDLPYVDNVYFRIDWNRVQSKPGELDLPREWRWMIDAVEERGKRWSFRIMNSSRHSIGTHSVPDFLADRLDLVGYRNEYQFGPRIKQYPAYTAEYLKRWAELVDLLAERYDSHPLLEFVDVSGYGIWGEGHHYGFHGDEAEVRNLHPDNAEPAIAALIEQHLAAFASTPVAMSLHYLDYDAGVAALQNPDVWLRRDSIQAFTSTVEWHAMADRAPGRAIIWETIVPSFGNQHAPLFTVERTPQRFLDFSAHYVAMGFNPWEVIQAHDLRIDLYEMLAARIGYRLRPAIVWRRVRDDGAHELVLALMNDGTTDVPGALTVTVTLPGGESVSVPLATGHPHPGERALTVVPLPRSAWELGSSSEIELSVDIRMRGRVRPVQWAVAQRSSDPFRLRMPLRMPAPGDPFTTRPDAYDPSF